MLYPFLNLKVSVPFSCATPEYENNYSAVNFYQITKNANQSHIKLRIKTKDGENYMSTLSKTHMLHYGENLMKLKHQYQHVTSFTEF